MYMYVYVLLYLFMPRPSRNPWPAPSPQSKIASRESPFLDKYCSRISHGPIVCVFTFLKAIWTLAPVLKMICKCYDGCIRILSQGPILGDQRIYFGDIHLEAGPFNSTLTSPDPHVSLGHSIPKVFKCNT